MILYLPFRPFYITQKWGGKNDAYLPFGFNRHNGLDVAPAMTTPPYTTLKTFPVYCPAEGFRVYLVRYSPKGGGNELWLISKEEVEIGGQKCYALLCFFHNEKVLVQAGYEPALGELVAIGDNTGFSTGAHSHIGLYRANQYGKTIDQNDANGSTDPSPYLSGDFAVDQATLPTLIKSNLRYYRYRAGL